MAICGQATSSEYSEESDLESLGGPGVSIGPHAGASRMKKKRDSQASYTSDMMESESDFRELEMNMDIIDEYYYGVRIFPGQDPSQVILFTVCCIKTVLAFLAFSCPLSRRLLLCIVFNSGVSVNDVNKD